MSKATVLLFSGQGSHYFQMGRELFEHDPVFGKCMRELESIARDHGSRSVLQSLYENGRSKGDKFDDVQITHPAIFMVELALARSLAARGVVPDFVLGTSLGAFVAAVLAGCVSAEQALVAVLEQARIVSAHCARGGMIAVLGSPALFHDSALCNGSELAARNFDSHFVVSAREDCLAQIEAHLRARKVAFERLALQYAFHSRWIDEAERPFRQFLETVRFERARLPMICSVHGRTLFSVAPDYLWTVARQPIRFPEAIAHLEQTGEYRYIDAGPSGTLATYLRYILRKESRSEVCKVLSPFGRDLASLNALGAAATSVS